MSFISDMKARSAGDTSGLVACTTANTPADLAWCGTITTKAHVASKTHNANEPGPWGGHERKKWDGWGG